MKSPLVHGSAVPHKPVCMWVIGRHNSAAATRVAAEAIGMADRIGTIESGKVADLAAFAGDPTADLAALSEVVAVFQEGRRVH